MYCREFYWNGNRNSCGEGRGGRTEFPSLFLEIESSSGEILKETCQDLVSALSASFSPGCQHPVLPSQLRDVIKRIFALHNGSVSQVKLGLCRGNRVEKKELEFQSGNF